jgi:ketosteroid isomerase-like protein
MNILRRSVLAGMIAAACAMAQSPADSEVKKAEESWAAAVKARDAAALQKMMSDDLVYTHSTGSSETRTQYLDKLKSGAQKYTGLEYSNMKVRSWGNAAVVNAQLRMTGATNGTPFDNTVLVTHVWVKQGGSWKLVSHQTTKKAS